MVAFTDRQQAIRQLREIDERFRPVTLAERQLLPVADALAPLFPSEGLRRGSIVSIGPATANPGLVSSLALAVAAEASQQGSWVALVGLPTIGLVAATELGVALDRLAVIDTLNRNDWPAVVAALVDAMDLVLVGPASVRPSDARRLAARVRERGAVLITVGSEWPEAPDVTLRAETGRWQGLGQGHGYLQARRVKVSSAGRREAARPRFVEVWLPAEGGGIATIEHPTVSALRPDPIARVDP